MLQRIEYARQQAARAREQAAACGESGTREEWLKAEGMWKELVQQCELLLRISELQ